MRETAGAILAWGDMPEPPVGVPEAAEVVRFATETALLWLRPDTFAAGSARAVLDRIAAAGFVTVGTDPARLEPGGVRVLW